MFGKTLLGACRRLLMVGVLAGMTWAAAAPAQAGPDRCCDNCNAQYGACLFACQRPPQLDCDLNCYFEYAGCGGQCPVQCPL